ncbi:MAG: aldo/keto reductase [Candidatus Njordarchaeia archaeon]
MNLPPVPPPSHPFLFARIHPPNKFGGFLRAFFVKYNIVERDIEQYIWPAMREMGIVIIAYSPLAKGLLTGKYNESTVFPEEDLRSRNPLYAIKSNYRQVLELNNLLKTIGEKYGKTVPQVAINWLLKFDDVFPIPGAKSVAHVESNLGAIGWWLSDEDWNKIKEASDELDLVFYSD